MSYAQKLRLPQLLDWCTRSLTACFHFGLVLRSNCFCLLLFQRYISSLPIERSLGKRSFRSSPSVSFGREFEDYNKCVCSSWDSNFSLFSQLSICLLLPLTHCRRACPLSTTIRRTSKNNSIDITSTDIDSSILPDIKISSLFLLPFSLLSLKIFIIVPFLFMICSISKWSPICIQVRFRNIIYIFTTEIIQHK